MKPVELATPPHRSPRVYVSELAVVLLLAAVRFAVQRTTGVPLSLVVTGPASHWRAALRNGQRYFLCRKGYNRGKALALGLAHVLTTALLCGGCSFLSAKHSQYEHDWRFHQGQQHILCFI